MRLSEKVERFVEVGQTISVNLIWRGQPYYLQMFFPGAKFPTRQEVTKQVQGIYPNAVVQTVSPTTTDPTKPTIRVAKEGWTAKYKKSIDCDNPKGFSQRAHCQGRKKMAEETVSEEGLRDWFGKSKSKDGKKGWVNVVTGDSCASDKPGEGIPKCVSSAKRASMSKKERRAAAAAKRREDPGQQRKSGAAAPTMVKTDRKKKTKKEELELLDAYGEPFAVIQDLIKPEPMKKEEPQIDLSTYDIEAMTEAKDKKGKGSGTKDACYHKVKSRYSVWPSAYASGALVKCRKVGAANWGNSKKEDFSYELNDEYYNTLFEKCWKGYEKKGMKTMFGKRYPNCVKKEETEVVEDKDPCWDTHKQVGMKKKGGKMVPNCVPKEEAVAEDWQKKSGKNPEGGLNEKGRKSYERENPGSDLKRPSKKVGNKRRASFCARMKGMKKKLTSAKTANDPDSRINKSLRAWNC